MDGYVTRVSGRSFDMEVVYGILEGLIQDINKKLEAKDLEPIIIDKESNQINLNKSTITIEENPHSIKFIKKSSSGGIGGLAIIDQWTSYSVNLLNGNNVGNFDDLESALTNVLKYLLINLPN